MEERRQEVQDRDRLVRLEEKMNHLEHILQENKHVSQNSINDLKRILEKFIEQQAALMSKKDDKILEIEKRVDKLYTIGAIGIFIIGPVFTIIGKTILTGLGVTL